MASDGAVPPGTDPEADGVADGQLNALAHPTRRSVYRCLLVEQRPLSVAEVAAAVGVSANMARRHLAELVAVGLADEADEQPAGRGRPRRLYLGRRDALVGWGRDGAFRTLARLLAELVRDRGDPHEVGYCHAVGAWSDADRSVDRVDRLWFNLVAAGFEPAIPAHQPPGTVVLGRCPVAEVAEVDPDTVCALHRGLMDGILDHPSRGVRLTPGTPREAGCVLRLPEALRPRFARPVETN